jgi:tetratricopeptide (TPR) repeat protein
MRGFFSTLIAATLLAGPARADGPAGGQASDGPRLTLDELRTAPAGLGDADLAQQRRLLASGPGPNRAEAAFRLAEHFRASALASGRTVREAGADASGSPFQRAARRRRAESAAKLEREQAGEAARLYDQAAALQSSRTDEALLHRASLSLRLGKTVEARQTLLRLIRDYPSSRYIPDAYAIFGDQFFGEGKTAEAQQLYRKVAAFPASSVTEYARYKEGWCELRLGNAARALERFVAGLRGRPAAALVAELRRGTVIAYAAVGQPVKAYVFFQRVGGSDATARAMLQELAAAYRAARRAGDAAVIESTLRVR